MWDDNDYSCKEEEPEKEKEKEDKVEDSSDLEPMEKEKERATLQEMRATGLRMNGKETNGIENRNEGSWVFEDETARQSQGWMNLKKIPTRSMDTTTEKVRKERNVMDLSKIKENNKVMGKEKQTM